MDPMYDQTAARIARPQGSVAPDQGDALPASPMQDFLKRATQRKADQEADPQRFTGPWVDPDPQAITALPEGRHPITMLMKELAQTPAGIAKRKNTLRHILAQLRGDTRVDVTWEDVMTYPWHQVTPDMAEAFRGEIYRRYSNRHTRHMYVQYLRSVIDRCQRSKLMSLEAAARVREKLPTKGARGRALHARRIKPEELASLLAACAEGDPFIAARDGAVFALFATTGMRVSELCRLDLADWDRNSEVMVLRETKNGRGHEVPVDPRVRFYLEAWLAVRGTAPGPLFTRSEGRVGPDDHMSTHAVRERLKILTKRAGIGKVCTHDFRRTVATTLLRTHDVFIVSRLLGHSSLAATMVYDLSGQEEQRAAIGSLPFPEVSLDPAREEGLDGE